MVALQNFNKTNYTHVPVLLKQVVEYLKPHTKEEKITFIDGTTGEGGHAQVFLSEFPSINMICVDTDSRILALAKERLAAYSSRVRFINSTFSRFFMNYDSFSEKRPQRILLDLGISRYHLEKSGLGFSFSRDELLDMRLDTNKTVLARDMVNSKSVDELINIFKLYGEERYAKKIAYRIDIERKHKAITSSKHLAQIIARAVPPSYRYKRLHPATRCFQALRIVVNNELEELETGLKAAFDVIEPAGRLGVISFHSLEDRIVKHFFKDKNKSCTCPPEWPICKCGGKKRLDILTKAALTPDLVEIESNPPSRSAKFRVAEKCV
jgi:16S rRNA (cytosine1402-N4)-methyltransferase